MLVELAEQGPHDFFARKVCGVQNAVVAVAPFQVQVELVVVGGGGCKLHAPFDQLLDGGGTALGKYVDRLFFAEASPCLQGICNVEFELVRFFGDCGNSSLGIVGGSVWLCPLGQDDHRKPLFCRVNRRAQSRNTSTKNKNVVHRNS